MRVTRLWPPVAAAVAVAGALTMLLLAAGPGPGATADELALLVAVATYAGVGLLVEHARPGHRVGRLLLVGASAWGLGEGLLALALLGHLHDLGSVPATPLLAVLGIALRGFGYLLLILLVPLLFPDGELPWGGRRAPLVLAAAALVLFTSATLLAPRPLDFRLESLDSPSGLPDRLRLVADGFALSALGLCVVSLAVAVAALVHRWRTGDQLRRQQLTWLCVAFAIPLVFLPFVATDLVAPWMFAVAVLPVPVAIAVAMLQRRLYDLQLAVARTLTWLALSAVVAVLYALTVGGVGALLSARGATWLPWVAAGVVAVSFAPLHRLLQQAVNRVTYGRWSQPAEVLAATGRRLADASDVPALLDALVVELATGLGLDFVEIRDGSGRRLAGQGAPGEAPPDRLPLTAYGVPVGTLTWHGPPLRPTDQHLLTDIAHQLGGVVHAAALLDSVRDAQHRLVLAREEERRRLRRDLHDGLGPQLAGLTLRVDTLRNKLSGAEVDPDAELVNLRSEIQSTVVDVRRIVEGLRPPALDELGLAGAVAQLVERTVGHLDAGLELGPLPGVPAAVEVALYRIAQEALANVVKHSGARRVRVRLRSEGPVVTAEIDDDGSGAAAPRRGGVGLGSMRERAEQIGGTLEVVSRPGTGTTVRVRLPLGVSNAPAPEAVSR